MNNIFVHFITTRINKTIMLIRKPLSREFPIQYPLATKNKTNRKPNEPRYSYIEKTIKSRLNYCVE